MMAFNKRCKRLMQRQKMIVTENVTHFLSDFQSRLPDDGHRKYVAYTALPYIKNI